MRGLTLRDVAFLGRPAASGGYAAEVLADSPIGYWRLEETSGSTVATEVGSFSGTRTGATMGGAGAVGTSYSFDGTDDHISLTTLGTFGANLASSTIEFWIKTATTASPFPFGTFNTGSTTAIQLNLNTTTAGSASVGSQRTWMYARDQDNNDVGWHMTANIYDGNWHHVAIVLGSDPQTSVQFFVDGSSVTTTKGTTAGGAGALDNFANFGFPLTFGARNVRGTIGAHAQCELDEIAIYNAELSSARIAAHYGAA